MPDDDTLRLDTVDDGYVLRRGTSEIALSEQDIINLGQTFPEMRDHILARYSRAGSIVPVVTTPVAQVGLNTDMLGENLILTLVLHSGVEMAYALPLGHAEHLVEHIPAHVARARGQNPRH